MIHIERLTKQFGPTRALNSVSLTFPDGEVVALIGPNGSGKTTLIKSILGLVIPDSGTITLGGAEIRGGWEYRSRIGYMPQISRYPDNMTVGELFHMVKDIRRAGTATLDTELLEAFRVPDLFSKRMYGLSGGQRQKISASLAFLFQPELLIFDEPTAGLDPVSTEIFRTKIKNAHAAGRRILITSHVLSELDGLVTWMTFMNEGTVALNESIDALRRRTGRETLNAMVSELLVRHAGEGAAS